MIDIFVSYSRKDRDTVKRLVEAMKSRGWSVWWDPTIRPGEYYEDVIEGALTDAKCVVVVWSKNSVASKWVRAEAAEAANRGVLVPVVIDNAKIPFRFKQIQEAHLSDWQFTPDHPGLVSLLESIAEKFIKGRDSQTASESQSAQVADSDDEFAESPVDEDVNPAQSVSRSIEPETVESENARPSSPIPVRPQKVAERKPAGQSTSPLASRKNLVAVALVVVGIMVVVGAIYAFAFRESAATNNQSELAQQNRAPGLPSNIRDPQAATQTLPPSTSTSQSAAASPAVSAAELKKIEGLLKGKWLNQNATAGDCYCSTSPCLDIQFNRTIPDFCVESNQISVSARYQLDAANNKAYLFFKEPVDLGVGGGQLPWDKFDRAKPLATIELSDLEAQGYLYVTWHGFTEKGTARQKWRQLGSGFQGTYTKQR